MIKSSKIFDRVYTNLVETFNADPAGCCVRISTYLPPLLKGESSLSRTRLLRPRNNLRSQRGVTLDGRRLLLVRLARVLY